MKPYYQVIRELREDHDLTQAQVAEILNTRQEYYSKYELGKRKLPIEHLITLCNYYRVSADYVLGLPTDYYRPEKKTKIEHGHNARKGPFHITKLPLDKAMVVRSADRRDKR